MKHRILLPLAAALTLVAGPITVAHAAVPAAAAPPVVAEAANAFGLGQYTWQSLDVRDLTGSLEKAAKTAGSPQSPTIVQLPSGNLTLTRAITVKPHIYLAAESSTTITWKGVSEQLLRFTSSGPNGVYGGTWDGGASKNGVVIVATSEGPTLTLANLTVKNGKKHGIAGYKGSKLILRNVTATRNENGVLLDNSTVSATGLRATSNQRNGLQLSANSRGTIVDSSLDGNGQAVKGSTDKKIGHGLAVAGSRAEVTNTSISGNKVCGVSLSGGGRVEISGGSLDRNGRHGIGTTPGAQATVFGARITRSGYNGVLSSGKGTSVDLTGVVIDGAKQYGLSLPEGGSATLTGTVVQSSGKSNVAMSKSAKLRLGDGNVIASAKQHGIAVAGKSALTVSGYGNVIRNNKKNGLTLDDKATLSLTGPNNEIRDNKENGLRLSGKGTTGKISAPVNITGNKVGILVKSKAKLTMVKSEVVNNKKNVQKSSRGTVTTK